MEQDGFERLFKKIKEVAGGGTQKEVAEKLGISPQAISDAKRKKRIPESWYGVIYEQFGVTRETLHCRTDRHANKVIPLFKNGQRASIQEKSIVAHVQDSELRGYEMMMDEFFVLVKQWLAEANGRSSRTAIDFIQEFPARFGEMEEWQRKKEKGKLFKFDRSKSGGRIVKGRG
nr:helix-turn-helix domain-containing protein [uncultured Desulfobulbus sp.]